MRYSSRSSTSLRTLKAPGTYTWVTESSAESGETVPEGLAATILAERAGPLLSERLSIRLGDSLPTLGDAIVEDAGTVYLQSIDIDCGSLTADLSFGIPDYLSPEDMASLLSGFRNKRTSTSSTVRVTGKPDQGDTVEMGAIPPLSSSEFAPGVKGKTTIRGRSSGGGSIVLDASALEAGDRITVRRLTMAGEDGEDKAVKVLATGDFELPAAGVKSVNGASGEISVIGGKGIEVSTDGQTVKITCSPDKDDEDDDPNGGDPCDHDGIGGAGGGVIADGGGGGGGGGVPADGDVHPGDDGCNCG